MNLVNINRNALSSFDAYSFNIRYGRPSGEVDEIAAGIGIDLVTLAPHLCLYLFPQATGLQRRLPPRKIELHLAGGGDGQASVSYSMARIQHRIAEEIHVFGPSSRGRSDLDLVAETVLSRGTAGCEELVVAKASRSH